MSKGFWDLYREFVSEADQYRDTFGEVPMPAHMAEELDNLAKALSEKRDLDYVLEQNRK